MKSIINLHKSDATVGIYSICSAHPIIIEATLRYELTTNSKVLIEATSNQVDQFGGYTGMKPKDFVEYIHGIAKSINFPISRILLGGDHLGPNRWQKETAKVAMIKSKELIKQYIEAGFVKIHLDASMSCSDDKVPLDPTVVAKRAATLCKVAETYATDAQKEILTYVIGTEVPVPGGETHEIDTVNLTKVVDIQVTIDTHIEAFKAEGIEDAIDRIIGIVVQPGVEFDHSQVIRFNKKEAGEISSFIESTPFVYEAHSTDYQTQQHLTDLVQGHFSILKVGPELTFALREGLFALAEIETKLVKVELNSQFKAVIDSVLLDNPKYWSAYYGNEHSTIMTNLHFSFSDRIRYYWTDERIQAAIKKMCENLDEVGIPLSILSQYLPHQYIRVSNGLLELTPHELLVDKVREIVEKYSNACK